MSGAQRITGAQGDFCASRNPIVNLLGQECFTPSSLALLLSSSKYLLQIIFPIAEVESLPGCAHNAFSVTTVRLISSHGTDLEWVCWYPRAEISYLSITEGMKNFEPWSLTRTPLGFSVLVLFSHYLPFASPELPEVSTWMSELCVLSIVSQNSHTKQINLACGGYFSCSICRVVIKADQACCVWFISFKTGSVSTPKKHPPCFLGPDYLFLRCDDGGRASNALSIGS